MKRESLSHSLSGLSVRKTESEVTASKTVIGEERECHRLSVFSICIGDERECRCVFSRIGIVEERQSFSLSLDCVERARLSLVCVSVCFQSCMYRYRDRVCLFVSRLETM
jgi:hypothetical protein